MKILVSGAAGFIGSKLMYELATHNFDVVGIDNLNDYYNPILKICRLKECGIFNNNDNFEYGDIVQSSTLNNCRFIKLSIDDKKNLDKLFYTEKFDKVVNLAAQAGVRFSITNPNEYIQSNIIGFFNILEACRNYNVKHLIYASSSSIYGLNKKVPYSETDKADTPISLYAATKKSNELMAHTYSKLYGIATTGLRFFTVYGPWGRPDMSPMLFASAILNDKPINVFNNGDMIRDFTYIDDIVEGTICAINTIPNIENCENRIPYKIYNIGCSNPINLMDFISEIENACGKTAIKNFLPMQPGDVYQTFADVSLLQCECNYKPHWELHDGVKKFIEWFMSEKNPLL